MDSREMSLHALRTMLVAVLLSAPGATQMSGDPARAQSAASGFGRAMPNPCA